MYLNLNEIHLPNFGAFREQKYIHRPLRVTDHASNLWHSAECSVEMKLSEDSEEEDIFEMIRSN